MTGGIEVTRLDEGAPVVVGALGGSGTRVLGEILIRSGVHLGSNLNTANDSVTATVIFNRPKWVEGAGDTEIDHAFETVRRLLLARDRTTRDYVDLVKAAMRPGHTEGVRRRLRYARRVRRERGPGATTRWGWKEPNSHLFVPSLDRVFPRMRFVYLARHPLDMAFSANLSQLTNWGSRFGVAATGDPSADARAQLDMWIGATRRIHRIGPELLGERFLAMRFDDLVDKPAKEIRRLLEFVAVPATERAVADLATLPTRPSSDGRHRDEDLSIFGPDQLDSVAELWERT